MNNNAYLLRKLISRPFLDDSEQQSIRSGIIAPSAMKRALHTSILADKATRLAKTVKVRRPKAAKVSSILIPVSSIPEII